MATTKKTLRRKSLGRTAFIGSLYDATRDTFYGTTILKTEFPNDSISRTDISHTELLHDYGDSYMKRFAKLDVEPELKLSVLSGLLTLEGSGKYLSDVQESQKSVKGTLIYKMTTVEENLTISRDDVIECISTDEFSNIDATHIVIGIKWGAVIMTSFECKNTKEQNRSQVEVALKSFFEKMKLPNSEDGVDMMDVKEEESNITSFTIKLLGDVIPHNKELLKFNELQKVIAKLPLCAKQYNGGKGVPIEYILYPLSELVNLPFQDITFNSMMTELTEDTILRTEQVFDSLFESKQKLNTLYAETYDIFDYIQNEVFYEINNYANKVMIEEDKFRQELADCLVKVRSGKGNINELESKIDEFQKSILSKESVMTFINQHRSVSIKANLALTLKDKNVEYLNKHFSIKHILDMNPKNEIYILIDRNDYLIDNLSPVQSVFRDLYNSDEGSSKFFIANLKVCTEIESSSYPVIQHYIDGKLVSGDYYKDNEVLFTSNIIKFDSEPSKNTPNQKVVLSLRCPQANCPSICCNWKCFRCKQNVEYGYNNCLYCNCGESKIANCKFKCCNSHHIGGYIPFELDKLISLLPSAPPEEINILLLGETGVGKSTFINAFMNYLRFDNLEDAKSGKIEVLIPSKFTITDENYEMKTIKIGDNNDSDEQLDKVGMSATQGCKSHVFHADENKLIRLIDTPGIGDTRGLDQDKKNFENILWYISHYKYLNGICILLKPNNARLNVVFRFCIQELLSHLHKNAKDNIVFCFTNARGTFYRPGDTLPSLKEQLEKLKEQTNVEIKVNKKTIYCFDSESFRFLVAIKENIQFEETDEQNFAESWKKSVNESLRLIEYFVTCPPHQVKDTLSLNNSRNLVILLSKPLAEMGQLIQTNIKLNENKQKELENSEQTTEELKDKLYFQQVDLDPTELKYPRTVCTSDGCIEVIQIQNHVKVINDINYKTHCDPCCYLPFVKCNVINSKMLYFCGAMGWNGLCKHCNCHWSMHMHITYETKQIVINEEISKQILENKSNQEIIKYIIEESKIRVNQLKEEQEKINEISLKFAQFLRQNALAPFNDAYADYLDLFIKEEKTKKNVDPINYDNEILEELEKTRNNYLEQVNIIKKAIENNDPSKPPITPKDIVELEQQLYALPHNGSTLKKIKDVAENSQRNAFTYKENHYMPSEDGVEKGKPSLLKSIAKSLAKKLEMISS